MASGLRSRRRVLAVSVLVATMLVAAGFAAGRLVRSPQQQAADARGPGATVLTVPVESRALTAKVVFRGDVVAGSKSDVNPPRGAGTPIVTGVRVKTGQEVRPAQVLAEVSGRPVFALPGRVPAYRDLRPGESGTDVRQLQVALKDLGFDPGGIDGMYGAPTGGAVKKLYESIGYQPLPASDSDGQTVEAANLSVRSAERAVQDAATAQRQTRSAARRSGAGQTEHDAAAAADLALSRAQQDLITAEQERDRAVATTGPTVPFGEYSFLPSFPVRVGDIKGVVGKPPSSPLITLLSGALHAVGVVPADQQALVKPGVAVQVVDETDGITASGAVSSVAQASSATAGGDEQVVVTPNGTWNQRLYGLNVRLTILGASTSGAALVVPVSALFTTADGSTRLTVSLPGGKTRDVVVRVSVDTGGYAAFEPEGGDVKAGDQVVISAAKGTGDPGVQGPP